jgi:glyoxylase-like metal-dependent hydrolase (beta-lactamase superfamily II)
MQLYTIDTGFFKLDGGAMFGVVPKSMWNKLNPADENNMCTWALRCLLIQEGNRLILVDTGMGNKQDAKFFSHYFLHGSATLSGSLAAAGFCVNDITDVILTHLHFDHCGGAIVRQGEQLVTAFPHANYWTNLAHWNWAIQPNDREKASFLKENILPIRDSGQLQFIETPDIEKEGVLQIVPFTEHISLRFANGHTDKMMMPQIHYQGQTIVYMADLLPSVEHIPLPYVMAYDMFPLTTLAEKKAFLQEAVDHQYILYFEHDPINECCIVQMTERGIRKKDCFPLSHIM